jgi:hippurate hydrolase
VTTLLDEASRLQGTISQYRRYLHENAEVHDELPVTTAFVKSRLEEMGYQPEMPCKSGVIALAGKTPGKTMLLRADMDALPISEETDLEFRSRSGHMHACGHDLHTAMLLGAAQLLKDHEDEIRGQVKLMFQPGEETGAGAMAMIEAGILDKPKVDAAFMVHVMTGIPIATGSIIIPQGGIVSASSDWYRVTILGQGGHGAAPNTAIDPLNILSHIHLALQAINAREIAPDENIVLTVGQMHGGETSNVIPESAFLSGTIRTFSQEKREFVKKRLEEISKGIASTFKGAATIEYEHTTPSLSIDQKLRDQCYNYTNELFDDSIVMDLEEALGVPQLTGSEDFAHVCEKVPGLMVIIGAGSTEEGYTFPMHHSKVTFNEEALSTGAAVYAHTAIEWLKHNK